MSDEFRHAERNRTHHARAVLLLVITPRMFTDEIARALGRTTDDTYKMMRKLESWGIVEKDPTARTRGKKPYRRRGPWRLTEDYYPQELREAQSRGLRAMREEANAQATERIRKGVEAAKRELEEQA